MPDRSDDQPIYTEKRLLNATIIGFMVGIYEVMGKGGTQAVINMAGHYVGKEILKFARDHNYRIVTLSDFQKFAREQGLAGQLDFHKTGEKAFVRISECNTCPKKVGHYKFDGTACPWGGILAGVMEEITGIRFSTSTRLTPGEACIIEFTIKS